MWLLDALYKYRDSKRAAVLYITMKRHRLVIYGKAQRQLQDS